MNHEHRIHLRVREQKQQGYIPRRQPNETAAFWKYSDPAQGHGSEHQHLCFFGLLWPVFQSIQGGSTIQLVVFAHFRPISRSRNLLVRKWYCGALDALLKVFPDVFG